MDKSITPNQIKQNNCSLIYRYIYENPRVSQQDIAYALRLSRPTITSNLSVLERDGRIFKVGQIDTEFVGRKASAYSVCSCYRVSIGVEILRKKIKMIAVDLYGKEIGHRSCSINYKNEDSYYQDICRRILLFKEELAIRDEQLLGIGFAIQGLISPDGQTVLYGKILSCTGLSISAFTRYLPYPCLFIHDADAAATSELWASPGLKDAFYLSLSRHLGAAIICGGRILTGKHGHSSTIEHISMEPEGELCYCGKRGCMETLCSMSTLLAKDETAEAFFQALRQKETSHIARWDVFLTNLAKAVNLLHLVYDKDFILGGYLAEYLRNEDLASLHEKIRQMTPFAESEDFLLISKMPEHNITIGAALPYIQEYLDAVF